MDIAEIKARARQCALKKVRIYGKEYVFLGVVSSIEYYYWVCYDGENVRYFSLDAPMVLTPKKGIDRSEWDEMRKFFTDDITKNNLNILYLK